MLIDLEIGKRNDNVNNGYVKRNQVCSKFVAVGYLTVQSRLLGPLKFLLI